MAGFGIEELGLRLGVGIETLLFSTGAMVVCDVVTFVDIIWVVGELLCAGAEVGDEVGVKVGGEIEVASGFPSFNRCCFSFSVSGVHIPWKQN